MKLFTLLLLFVAFFCSCEEKRISIVPINRFNIQDSSRNGNAKFKNKNENYIIVNFTAHAQMSLFADSVAERDAFANADKLENYSIAFFKSSEKTDVAHLQQNPSDFNSHSKPEDLVFLYKWKNGNYVVRDFIKDGKVMDFRVNISRYYN